MDWLMKVEADVGKGIITLWKSQLHPKSDHHHDEREHLLDFLQTCNLAVWRHHLYQQALLIAKQERVRAHAKPAQTPTIPTQEHVQASAKQAHLRPYSIDEIRRMNAMLPRPPTPGAHALLDVFAGDEGTLCFGRALRQLGRADPARFRDLLDLLEPVQTPAGLCKVLQRIIQECEVAKADFPYIPRGSPYDLVCCPLSASGADR
jgi:hypothetical protein